MHEALSGLGQAPTPEVSAERPKPAVPIRKSITDEYLISLEDGRKFKSLSRHLTTEYGITPADFQMKWACRPTTR